MARAKHDELRIALSMRGGVSLAVWIGGAVLELDRLTRCKPDQDTVTALLEGPDFYRTLLDIAGYRRATIDVISGASAGGLNGVVLGASRAYGFDFAEMLPLWVELGDIELLTRDPTTRSRDPVSGAWTHRPDSLLQGDDYFQKRLEGGLRTLVSTAEASSTEDESRLRSDPFQLVLSATLVNPAYETTSEDPFAPLPEVRRTADFEFHFTGALGEEGCDFEKVGPSVAAGALGTGKGSTVSLLALAGRATSSFPVAFEPAKVGPFSAAVFSDPPAPDGPARLVLDGGVLDNIPVSKALEAVASTTVVGPSDRWLVFLHPSPSERTEQAITTVGLNSPRALRTLVITATTAFSQESLLDDLDKLRQHNARTLQQRVRRSALLCGISETLATDPPAAIKEFAALASQSAPPAMHMRANLDAMRAVAILAGERRPRQPITTELGNSNPSTMQEAATKVRRDRTRFHEKIAEAYQSALARHADADGGDHVVVLTTAGLRIECDVVAKWIASSTKQDDPAVAFAARRLDHLRRVVHDAQEWSDQAWLVAAVKGASPDAPWPAESVERAIGSLRRIPNAAADEMNAAYDALDPDKVESQFVAALQPVNAAVRTWLHEGGDGDWDVARWVHGRLCDIVQDSAAAVGPPDPHVAHDVSVEILHADHADPDVALTRLVTVLTRTQTVEFESDGEVKFVRVTGGNVSPLASHFATDGKFGVDQKLCGNDLGNFAAFFSAKWRANDWMWGRMDAVKSIVDLVIRPERLADSALQPDDIVTQVRVLANRSGMPLDHDEIKCLTNEVTAAIKGAAGTDGLPFLRKTLTEAMQRQIFDQMNPLIQSLRSLPHWPAGTELRNGMRQLADSGELDDAMGQYRVGSESLRDIESRRRTEIGMRLAMVGYSAIRPRPAGVGSRAVAVVMSLAKPLYLFTAFFALNAARAMFVVNMTAVGFWIGPWRYAHHDRASEHVPWELFTHEPSTSRWWHDTVAPHTRREWIGFVVILLLSCASLALLVRLLRKRAQTAPGRKQPRGRAWFAASGVVGLGALAVNSSTGVCTGPLTVMIGAAAIAYFTCLWMRPSATAIVCLGTAAVYFLVGLVYWLVAVHTETVDAERYASWWGGTGWMSLIAAYAATALIAIVCTYVRVLHSGPDLQARARQGP